MAYRIVGELEGTEITFTSTHPDREKREEIFETIEEAEDALNTLKMSLPDGTKLTIEPAVQRQMIDFETAMRQVRATLGFEGLVLTEEEEKLLERRFHGEITEEEYIRKALELSYL